MFRKKSTRIIAFMLALAFGISALPMLGAVAFVVRAFDPLDFHHAHPTQNEIAFSSHVFDNIGNPDFNNPGPSVGQAFISNVDGGWTRNHIGGDALTGIVNTNMFNTFRDNNNLTTSTVPFMTNPGNNNRDGNLLVMANRSVVATSQVGFHSNSLEFHADGFFIVEINFYAARSWNAVYLLSDAFDKEINTSITTRPITSQDIDGTVPVDTSHWRTATFFVQTDARQSINVQIGLYLGTQEVPSNGVVYYDYIRARAVNPDRYAHYYGKALEDSDTKQFMREINLRQDQPTKDWHDYEVGIEDFQDNFSVPHSSKAGLVKPMDVPGELRFDPEHAKFLHPHAPKVGGGEHKILLLAARDNRMAMNIDFTIERNLLYMISFYSLTHNSPSLRIFDIRGNDPDIEAFDERHQITSESTPSQSSRNGWSLNTFFVMGEVLSDRNVKIEFWVGTADTVATGWLLVDDFKISRVPFEYYDKHQNSANTEKFNMNKSDATSPISNANFNLGNVRSALAPFPLHPQGWELDASKNAISGIVNTQASHWSKYAKISIDNGSREGGYYPNINPAGVGPAIPNSNVMMLQNFDAAYQTLRSNTFPLSRGEEEPVYNYISFDAYIFRPDGAFDFLATIEFNGHVIAWIDLKNAPAMQWRTFSFAVRDGVFTTRDVSLVFHMGTERKPTGAGVVFLDNVRVQELQTIGTTTSNTPDAIADLSKPITIVDMNGKSVFFAPENDSPLETIPGSSWLSIGTSALPTHATLTSAFPEELEGGGYFEYVVVAHIMNDLDWKRNPDPNQWLDKDGKVIAEPDKTDHGVSLRINGFQGGFENIRPGNMQGIQVFDEHDFVEFRFLIHPDASTSLALVIEFGNQWRHVKGTILIRETRLSTLTSDQWNYYNNNIDKYAGVRLITEPDYVHIPDRPKPNQGDGVDWMIVLSSIILALAIIMAVAVRLLRRHNFNRHIVKKHTSYALDDRGIGGAEQLRTRKGSKPESLPAQTYDVSVDEDD